MSKISLLIFLALPVAAQEIAGVWKLTNHERPFKFSSAVSYEMNFQFNKDGTLHLLQNHANALGSTRHYELNRNELKVMLKNKNMNTANNVGLRMISSQTLVLTPISSECYQAIDKDEKTNTFIMCKVK